MNATCELISLAISKLTLARPSDISNFFIAVLCEGPESVTHLLGTVNMTRGEILTKAKDEQFQVVGMCRILIIPAAQSMYRAVTAYCKR